MGFCPQCRSEEPLTETETPRRRATGIQQPVPLGEVGASPVARLPVGIGELDRVLGGGLVAGSVVLLGGEPGVGKSTLLLQAAGTLAGQQRRVLVATAEESADQVGLRAQRLGITSNDVLLFPDHDVDAVLSAAEEAKPELLVVDSIQTVGVAELGSAPGSVAQVRESAARLIRFAKTQGVPTVLVGHVTKEGSLAGPKLLEHMVDVVLSLEGDPDRGFRALRSLKNRFGPTHVVGMFDMRSEGMVEVEDPSQAFLEQWQAAVPGTVVFPAVEGQRSVLVEVQALVTASPLPQPRRSIRGVELTRVHQILAVLARHGEVSTAHHDVYVNVVGGWRLDEPGADLAVALAVASSAINRPLGSVAAWGEVGLAGEVRPVPFGLRRREECERLGVERIIAPNGGRFRTIEALAMAGLFDG